MERGENIGSLLSKSGSLSSDAQNFRKQTSELRKHVWWKAQRCKVRALGSSMAWHGVQSNWRYPRSVLCQVGGPRAALGPSVCTGGAADLRVLLLRHRDLRGRGHVLRGRGPDAVPRGA